MEHYKLKTLQKKLKLVTDMDKKVIKFDDTEIEKYEFSQYKNAILINDIDINEIVVSNMLPSGKQDFKYFIGYKIPLLFVYE